MRKKSLIIFTLLLSISLLNEVYAASFNVDSQLDVADDLIDGTCLATLPDLTTACTFRAAIMEANANGVDDEIIIPAGIYEINIASGPEGNLDTLEDMGDFDITTMGMESLTIIGDGAGKTIVDAKSISRVFHIRGPGITVILEGLTIRGGLILAEAAQGRGSGVYVDSANFSLLDSEIIESENNHIDGGGGLFMIETNFELSGSVIAANECTNAQGAGIYLSTNSTGIIENSTLSGNTANNNGGAIFVGGLIGDVLVNFTTIIDNQASAFGGIKGYIFIKNSIVAGNKAILSAAASDFSTEVQSQGNNLVGIGDESFTLIDGSDQFGSVEAPLDPRLSELSYNGGSTRTYLPLIDSPAIDAADPADCSGTDQRGEPRPFPGTNCDIGAVELQSNCGDGIQDNDETCDLGVENGEVTATCTTECTSKLAGEPNITCGNGTVEAPEECDDGNNIDDDLCSNTCLNVATNPPGNEGSGGCAISANNGFNYFYLAVISLILGWVIVRPRIVRQHGGNETR